MVLGPLPKKLVRTAARVIPQCGMVSQAVAFNMFLVFFPSLLLAIGLMSRSLSGKERTGPGHPTHHNYAAWQLAAYI